jgi:hypothetical protein
MLRRAQRRLYSLAIAIVALLACVIPQSALGVDDLAVSSGGRILLTARDSGKLTLSMLDPDGGIDAGFGTGGTMIPRFFGVAATLQPDGKVLVAGARGRTALLYRYRRDGSVDRSFGSKKRPGRQRIHSHPKASTLEGQGVVVRPNGKIAMAAFYECFGADSGCGYTQDYFHLLRFTPSGRYLGNGSVYGGTVYGISRAPHGKTLVIGNANEGDWTVAARFNRRAQADKSFGDHGHDGWSLLSFTPADVDAQSDGSPVIAMEGGVARGRSTRASGHPAGRRYRRATSTLLSGLRYRPTARSSSRRWRPTGRPSSSAAIRAKESRTPPSGLVE